jgi:hypothetical protein
MSKFKVGDKIVCVSGEERHTPLGYIAEVTKMYCYIDNSGSEVGVYDCSWELAEDTSKPVTVTHEGNVYEIGKYYLFRMHSVTWTLGILEKINNSHTCYFCTPFKEWLYIKEIPASENIGTITPAPIELIDGNAYMFDYEGKQTIGLYYKLNDMFYMSDFSLSVKKCTNIRPMTVTESK